MTILECVRNFISTCPYLEEYKEGIGVDILGEDAVGYAIETLPADPVIKEYVNGDSERRFTFLFVANEWYTTDVITNIENIGFFDDFSDWCDTCTKEKALPDLGDDRTALSLSATLTPYLYDEKTNKARYQIQCELDYYKRR